MLNTIEAVDTSLQASLARLQHQGGRFIELLILNDLMPSVPDERAIPVRQRIAIAVEDGLEAHHTQAVAKPLLIEGGLSSKHLGQDLLDRHQVDALPLTPKATAGTSSDEEEHHQQCSQWSKAKGRETERHRGKGVSYSSVCGVSFVARDGESDSKASAKVRR